MRRCLKPTAGVRSLLSSGLQAAAVAAVAGVVVVVAVAIVGDGLLEAADYQ